MPVPVPPSMPFSVAGTVALACAAAAAAPTATATSRDALRVLAAMGRSSARLHRRSGTVDLTHSGTPAPVPHRDRAIKGPQHPADKGAPGWQRFGRQGDRHDEPG